ncbi:MAG: gluconokinase [Pseudomonadota bacterium]
MGVSGVGKSRLGVALGERLGWEFVDGDDLHPAGNIAKMSAGEPLTDEDRWPWLDAIGARLAASEAPLLLACSALKRAYRDRLGMGDEGIFFLHLSGETDIIAGRLDKRQGHFMARTLLDDQVSTLEPLGSDEFGARLDIRAPFTDVLEGAERLLRGQGA